MEIFDRIRVLAASEYSDCFPASHDTTGNVENKIFFFFFSFSLNDLSLRITSWDRFEQNRNTQMMIVSTRSVVGGRGWELNVEL